MLKKIKNFIIAVTLISIIFCIAVSAASIYTGETAWFNVSYNKSYELDWENSAHTHSIAKIYYDFKRGNAVSADKITVSLYDFSGDQTKTEIYMNNTNGETISKTVPYDYYYYNIELKGKLWVGTTYTITKFTTTYDYGQVFIEGT